MKTSFLLVSVFYACAMYCIVFGPRELHGEPVTEMAPPSIQNLLKKQSARNLTDVTDNEVVSGHISFGKCQRNAVKPGRDEDWKAESMQKRIPVVYIIYRKQDGLNDGSLSKWTQVLYFNAVMLLFATGAFVLPAVCTWKNSRNSSSVPVPLSTVSMLRETMKWRVEYFSKRLLKQSEEEKLLKQSEKMKLLE